jgi:uncharacterized protein DUF6883
MIGTQQPESSGHQEAAPVVFLINAEDSTLDSWYGPTIKRELLSAVLEADKNGKCAFQTYWGNLLTLFTYRAVRSSALPIMPNLPQGLTDSLLSTTYFVDDFSARYTLLCGLCDTAAESWNTIDQLQAPWILYSRSIYISMVSSLTHDVRVEVDRRLSQFDWYLGAMEVDRTDPLQRRLFGESLIPLWFYRHGWVGTEFREDEDEPAELFEGVKAKGFGWANSRPQLVPPPPIQWSAAPPQGSKSQILLQRITRRTHNEVLTSQIHELGLKGKTKRTVSFESSRPEPDIDSLRGKLWDYVLNPEKSKGKAELFQTALNIEREDWRFLAIQLVDGLRHATPRNLRDEQPWGEYQHLQYDVSVPVLGRNGHKKLVKSAWKIVDDGCAELVTAYLDDRKKTADLVDHNAQLFNTAKSIADHALNYCIPTPMTLQSSSGDVTTIRQGMMGWAWVRFPDARNRFARWLLTQNLASKSHPGAKIFAPSQYVEPSRAWADAFAEVLQVNGHACETGYYVD